MTKMHADELDIDAALASRLVAAQFPRWAGLPLQRVRSAGTDNAIFRLGDELAVRLPRYAAAAGQAEKEQRWLPVLAPRLPLAIPVPLAIGVPAADYPFHWSVCGWLEGDNAAATPPADIEEAAGMLAGFIVALRAIDTDGAPPPGPHNSNRGVPMLARDAQVRQAIADLGGLVDAVAVTAAWQAALEAPAWDGPPVWLHGDIHPENLIVRQGRISAVIDFGCLGVGDPACDLMLAWMLLTRETRPSFRAALEADKAAWARGRGWALSVALIALPYYLDSNPGICARSRHTIAEVLADS